MGLVLLLTATDGVTRLAELRTARTGRPVGQQAAQLIHDLYTSYRLR